MRLVSVYVGCVVMMLVIVATCVLLLRTRGMSRGGDLMTEMMCFFLLRVMLDLCLT